MKPQEQQLMLYVVSVDLRLGATLTDIQKQLNTANSWYRYMETSWIICTQEKASIWSKRLAQFVRPDGNLFICKLDIIDYQGWMSEAFWNWLAEHK